MSDTQVIDGTADELGVEVVQHQTPAPVLAVTPQVKATELVERLSVIREAMDTAMTPDVDYGVIPGTNKPALLKPGAEKLSVLFQLDVQLVNEKHWQGDHLTVESKATVYHIPTGARVGFGEGMCSTREKKYAYRKQERSCPACGVAAVIKGKAEYGGGWLCWKKRDGCDAKFPDGDPAIAGQDVGQIDNPDLPDAWNTVVKMAEKRARVDAVLAVTGASALFTQDIEADESADLPAPAQRDVKRTEATDVPASDPWFAEVKPLLKGVPSAGLKLAVKAAGGTVPERVSSWEGVICALDAEGREGFVKALSELKGDPWSEEQQTLGAVTPHEPFSLEEAEAS